MTRKRFALIATVLLLGLATLLIFVLRQRVQRRRVFHPQVVVKAPVRGIPPVEQWTDTFMRASAEDLDEMLDAIEQQRPELYKRWSLSYLHARALVEEDKPAEAAVKLRPYLAKGHPFRDLALYHSGDRMTLILEYPQSVYRDEAIDEYLAEEDDAKALIDFATKIAPSASTDRRREMSSRIVEALVEEDRIDEALTRGLTILRGGTQDDAADRVVRALDRKDAMSRLDVAQLAMFGETFHQHRHYDRAIAVLQKAVRQRYSDDLQFALGRSYYGAEKYLDAQNAYLRGANATKSASQKTTFFWHAARAAQLQGEDAVAERLMTSAIAVKGKFPATTPALTQRLRTRLEQGRVREAASDLVLLRRIAPNERAVVEGSLAYAVGMIARKRPKAAISALNSVPPKLLTKEDREEFAYWKQKAQAPTRMSYDVLRRPRTSHRTPTLPKFPEAKSPEELLMAMGLFDEAVPAIEKRWGFASPEEALTRAYALNLAGASRESIYAAEVLVRRWPDEADSQLVHDLLYPRFFYAYIAEDAKKYGVDPALVLAIMREESRFNARAKSQAAARGLLQLIITTARDIGRDVGLVDVEPEDLYDPRVIIRLGTKYLSDLGEDLEGNRYRIAAAYNAGPKQVELWTRLQAAPGDDYFLAAISFDETKNYVKKVMQSYEVYSSQ